MARHCPLCHKELPEKPGPYRPFCSPRCKLLDLGKWLDGSYRLSGPEVGGAEGKDEVSEAESGEAPSPDE